MVRRLAPLVLALGCAAGCANDPVSTRPEAIAMAFGRSKNTERLENLLGVKVYEGHSADNIGDAQVVVYSSAVKRENPEVMAAKEKKIPVIPRAEMLAELMTLKPYSVAIAGSHGKTSTTSMVATILGHAGIDPTTIVGGVVDTLGSNAKLGDSEWFVTEADESDRSFLML